MYATTELVPLLAERGIILSASQVHRLVTSTPERLSLPILAALCDIFAVDAAELIPTDATNVGVRKVASGDRPAPGRVADLADLRPVRARIVDPRSEHDPPGRLVAAADRMLECARCRPPTAAPPPDADRRPRTRAAGSWSRSGTGPRAGSARAASRRRVRPTASATAAVSTGCCPGRAGRATLVHRLRRWASATSPAPAAGRKAGTTTAASAAAAC